MNKKEQALLKAAQARVELLLALHWPDKPKPAIVHVPTEYPDRKSDDLVVGYFINTYGGTINISKGCSNGTFHNRDNPIKTSSQGHGAFYRTFDDAVLACRWEICNRTAEQLARLAVATEEVWVRP